VTAPARRLRLGMVGGGVGAFIGAVHRMAARLDDRYVLVAGALSSDRERAQVSGQRLGLASDRIYGSFGDMATAEAKRDDGIDAVAIVTPNHVHHAVAVAFLDAGIHVICDKPLTTSLEQARDLVRRVRRSGLVFGLTHNYTGYPLVRHARAMVGDGRLGRLRLVQVEYAQDWLTTPLEADGNKQAAWRTDPERSGPAGCLGDIGTHAFNLASFITDLQLDAVAADVTTFVEDRRVDDNCQVMLRYESGCRGALWASQVAPGNENNLRIRIYGERGGLSWCQENPNRLEYAPFGEPVQILTRGGPGTSASANRATRIPAGHPEGYLEGFANLYADLAEQITARLEARSPDPEAMLVPGVEDGARAVQFIESTLASSRRGGAWVDARMRWQDDA